MTNISAPRDANRVPTLIGVSSADGVTPTTVYVDPVTHRLYVDIASISNLFQTDTFTSTNNQTIFTASANVAYTTYLSVNGSVQTPSVDYTVSGGVATLANGIPSGNIVVWQYITA